MSTGALLAIFIGGGAGSLLRYLISWYLPWQDGFPWATWWANVLACLFLGALMSLLPLMSDNTRVLLLTGFCGGLSTFSALSRETFMMAERGEWLLAIGYVLSSIVAGLLALFITYMLFARH
jgi:CrcB protein